jgi:hypothetical protein
MIATIYGVNAEGTAGVLAHTEFRSLEIAQQHAQEVLDHIGQKDGQKYILKTVEDQSCFKVAGLEWQSWKFV